MERELTGTKLFNYFKYGWTIPRVIHPLVQGQCIHEETGLETGGKDCPALFLIRQDT